MVKIKANIFWCQHNRVNDMSGKYQVDLGGLSDAAVAALTDLGIEVKHKEELGHFITCKSEKPIKITDQLGVDLADKNIGNLSECKAMIRPYEWAYKNKKGVSPSLQGCVVTKLIEFGDAAAALADDEDVL